MEIEVLEGVADGVDGTGLRSALYLDQDSFYPMSLVRSVALNLDHALVSPVSDAEWYGGRWRTKHDISLGSSTPNGASNGSDSFIRMSHWCS